MQKITLQVPMQKSLKDAAQAAALDNGFSSLQETIRVFLTKFAKGKLAITIEENVEYLTDREEAVLARKYAKAKEEIAGGKGFLAKNAEELVKQLRRV